MCVCVCLCVCVCVCVCVCNLFVVGVSSFFKPHSAHGQLKRLIKTVILLLATLCSTYRRGIHEAPI
jgi:hypothetical protein